MDWQEQIENQFVIIGVFQFYMIFKETTRPLPFQVNFFTLPVFVFGEERNRQTDTGFVEVLHSLC